MPFRTALVALLATLLLSAASAAAQGPQNSKMRPTRGGDGSPSSDLGFNSLESIVVDPATGNVELVGRELANGPRAIPYEQVLTEAWANPGPQFSLDSDFSRFTRRNLAGKSLEDLLFTERGGLTSFARVTLETLGVPPPRSPDRTGYTVVILRHAGFGDAAELREAILEEDGVFDVNRTLSGWIEILDLVPSFQAFNIANREGDTEAADAFYLQLLRGLDDSLQGHGNDPPSLFRQLRGTGASPDMALRHGMRSFLESFEALSVEAISILLERQDQAAVVYSSEDLQNAFGTTPVSRPQFVNLRGNTQLARLLYEGDLALKSIPFDTSLASVDGYETLPRWTDAYIDRSDLGSSAETRYWITVESVKLQESTDGNVATIASVNLRVESRTKALDEPWSAERIDPVTKAYADLLTESFDEIALLMPELYNLREAAKVVTLANWLRGKSLQPQFDVPMVEWDAPSEVSGFLAMMPYLRDRIVVWGTWPSGGVDFDFSGKIEIEKNPGLTSESVRSRADEAVEAEAERRELLLGPVDVRGLKTARSQMLREQIQAEVNEAKRVFRLHERIQTVADAVGLLNRFLLDTQRLQAGALHESGAFLAEAAKRAEGIARAIEELPSDVRGAVEAGLSGPRADPEELRKLAAAFLQALEPLEATSFRSFDSRRVGALARAGETGELTALREGVRGWDESLQNLEKESAAAYESLGAACTDLEPLVRAVGRAHTSYEVYGSRTALMNELLPQLSLASATLASLNQILSRQLDDLEQDRILLDSLRS